MLCLEVFLINVCFSSLQRFALLMSLVRSCKSRVTLYFPSPHLFPVLGGYAVSCNPVRLMILGCLAVSRRHMLHTHGRSIDRGAKKQGSHRRPQNLQKRFSTDTRRLFVKTRLDRATLSGKKLDDVHKVVMSRAGNRSYESDLSTKTLASNTTVIMN